MRVPLVLVSLALLFAPAHAASGKDNFGGKWLWKSKTASFEVHLVQTGQRIKGAHFAYIGLGRKLDNQEHPEENGPSIAGIVTGNTAKVDITSAHSDTSGKATMTLEKGKLRWLVTQKPTGEYYFPDSVVLSRQKGPVDAIADEPKPDVQAFRLSIKAREFEEQGKLQDALENINSAIKLNSSDWTNYSTRASVLEKLNKCDTAISDFTRALEACPEDTRKMILPSRGHCYVVTKKPDLAVVDLTQAIQALEKGLAENQALKPYLIKAYSNRVDAYKLLGKNDLASRDESRLKALGK